MRKILFALVIIVLIIFTGIVMYKGIAFGKNAHIWGIKQIAEENDEIDLKAKELNDLVENQYPISLKSLTLSGEQLDNTKKEYENQAILLSDSKYYKQTEKYKMEFLWTKIGNYARDNKVTLELELSSTSTKGIYDLHFTVNGSYAKVAQFIYDIENDSRLGFKVENFSMVAATSTDKEGNTTYNTVKGKFVCKEVKIDVKTVDASTVKSTNTTTKTTTTNEKEETTNTTNTMNMTNTTNTTETTNTMNTTNTTNEANTTSENVTP